MTKIQDASADFSDYHAKAKAKIDELTAENAALKAAATVPAGASDDEVAALMTAIDAAKAEIG